MNQVLIVDDHPLVAVALQAALRGHAVEARHVDPTSRAAVVAAMHGSRGLAVVDLDLGDGRGEVVDGVQVVGMARSAGWRSLLLTGSADRARIAAALAAGALGHLVKSTAFEEIVVTVAAAARGEDVFDPVHRAELVAEHHRSSSARRDLDRRWERLTPRERQIMADLVDGKRVADVARDSVVAESTVRTQVRSILAKLEVHSQLEAVALARRIG